MSVRYEKHENIVVVHVSGHLNSDSSPSLEAVLHELVNDKKELNILLDLSGLVYISSAGLRVVLVSASQLKQHAGRLVLCCMQPQVREVFDISGFLMMLPTVESHEEGIAAFKN